MSESAKSSVPAPSARPNGNKKGLQSVPRKTLTAGQIAAIEVERAAKAQREGKEPEPFVADDAIEEDWQNDTAKARPTADKELAGLYRVKHGNLWFGPSKIVHGPREVDGVKQPGRKVCLTAEEARLFLEQGLVERLD